MIAHTDDPQLQRMLDLVSSRTGVIRSLSKVVRGIEEPSLPIMYQATLSNFDYRVAPPEERLAAGKGLTDDAAMRAAFGEAIEHYCAAQVDEHKTRLAKWSELDVKSISPPEFVLYSDTQYEREGFTHHRWKEDDEVTWSPVRELPEDHEVLAPTSLVYLTSSMTRAEDRLTFSTSNGLAAGPNLKFAILNGLYELIERDGFLINWMNKLPAPEVEFSDEGGLAQNIKGHYEANGTTLRVFNVSSELPAYVMMCIALDTTGEGPAAMVGLGCNLDPRVALLKSIFEICQMHPGEAQRFRKEPPEEKLTRYEDVLTLFDHSAYLMVPERLHEFDFLLKNGRRQSIADLPNLSEGNVEADLSGCVNSLRAAGCRVAYAELTTSDIAPFNVHVVRTIATGLQPMHFGFGEERLGGSRLFEVPQRLGLAEGIRTEKDLNNCPHPLA
jgi:ribosomal protein S12 methylthiotransferase accessory factor